MALIPPMLVVIIVMPVVVIIIGIGSGARDLAGNGLHFHCFHGFFNNFIQFTTIQPNSTAGRAIIDLDPLAFRHHQIWLLAYRTLHNESPSIEFNINRNYFRSSQKLAGQAPMSIDH
jgi:hypothetical protein